MIILSIAALTMMVSRMGENIGPSLGVWAEYASLRID